MAAGNDELYGGEGADLLYSPTTSIKYTPVMISSWISILMRVIPSTTATGIYSLTFLEGEPVDTIEETVGNAGAYFVDGNGDYLLMVVVLKYVMVEVGCLRFNFRDMRCLESAGRI